jgi:hypothetical protein
MKPTLRKVFEMPWVIVTCCLAAAAGCGKSENTSPAAKTTNASTNESASGGRFKREPEAPAALTASAEKNSFREVTSKLDAGGNLFLYLSTEQWLDGLSAKLGGFRQLIDNLPDVKAEDQENISKVFGIITNLVHDIGIEDVSGFGVSSLAVEKGFYRSKMLVHHYPEKGNGFLWKLFGEAPHALEGLNFLPTNTAAATFSDLNLAQLWTVLQKEARQSGFPQAAEALDKFPAMFEQGTKLKWDKVLASLGNEYGVVLTLNSEKNITVPLPGHPLDVPEPGLAFFLKVNDDLIFNRVAEVLKATGLSVASVDKPDLKMRTVAVPLPLPINLTPTLAQAGGYLIIASSDKMIEEMLAVKAGTRPGIKSTPEFQHLTKDIPAQGNQFGFLSQHFGESLGKVQQQAFASAGNLPPAQLKLIQSMMQPGSAGYSYSIGANTPEGWLTIGKGNQNPGKGLLLAGAVVPVALISAVAIPSFAKARGVAQKTACINNLRQIEAAKQTWALENKKGEHDIPTQEDLKPYLTHGLPVCPLGGTYTINEVATPSICSVAGHHLNE